MFVTSVQDMELSRDINSAFKQHVQNNYPSPDHEYRRIDLSVNVLSVAYWPTYTVMEVTIPGQLQAFTIGKKTISVV